MTSTKNCVASSSLDRVGLTVDDVQSVSIPNAQRPNLPVYAHQIDLYWETGDEIAQYLNIANAKWRAADKIEQGEVMLLGKVREKVAAHKAFMISSVGFTAGAVASAKDEGIALHVLTPTFESTTLPRGDRTAIRDALQDLARSSSRPIYDYVIECRGLDFAPTSAPAHPSPAALPHPQMQTRVAPPATTRMVRGPERRDGPSPRTSGPPGGFDHRG